MLSLYVQGFFVFNPLIHPRRFAPQYGEIVSKARIFAFILYVFVAILLVFTAIGSFITLFLFQGRLISAFILFISLLLLFRLSSNVKTSYETAMVSGAKTILPGEIIEAKLIKIKGYIGFQYYNLQMRYRVTSPEGRELTKVETCIRKDLNPEDNLLPPVGTKIQVLYLNDQIYRAL